ncbi:MAG: hypothetical protein NXI04_07240 [Planctomycetaceae bacterium]|nr:hypothetical protein [Planctomycetaceae bacterium]
MSVRRLLIIAVAGLSVLGSLLCWPPSEPASQTGGFHRPTDAVTAVALDASGRDSRGRIFVPAHARLAIGSLDQSAQFHSVSIEWQQQQTQPVGMDLRYSTDVPFDVYRPGACVRVQPAASLAGYENQGVPPVECTRGDEVRRFAVPFFPRTGAAMERFVVGDLVAAGGRTRVFLTHDGATEPPADVIQRAHEIVRLTELGLRDFVEEQLSPISDLDHDGHLTFVFCDLAEQIDVAGVEPIRGCVRQKDFFDHTWSFGGDIVYLDYDLPGGEQLAAVLAHELAHAAIFSIRRSLLANNSDAGQLPFWMNEGIAHLIEFSVCPVSDNLAGRIRDFRDRPNSFPLVIPDSYRGRGLRRGPSRAAALSFFRFAVATDPEFLTNVVTARYGGPLDPSQDNLPAVRFPQIFREWMSQERAESPRLSLTPDKLCRLTLAGTAFVQFEPAAAAGFVSVRAPQSAQLQIVIVDPPASPARVAVEPAAGNIEL